MIDKVLTLTVFLAIASANNNAIPHDIWTNAETYFQEFVAALEASLEEADKRHDEIIQELAFVSNEALVNSSDAIAKVVDYMYAQVEDIRSQETEETKDLFQECILEYSGEMRILPKNLMQLIIGCVRDLENTTTQDVHKSRDQCQDFVKEADRVRADIDSCRIASNSDECISRLVIEILLLTLEIPSNIEELTRALVDLVEFYVREVPSCIGDRIETAEVASNAIIDLIKDCISSGRS